MRGVLFVWCVFLSLLSGSSAKPKRRALGRHSTPQPGETYLSQFSPYSTAPKAKALEDLLLWAEKAAGETQQQTAIIEFLKAQQKAADEQEDEDPDNEGEQQQEQQGQQDAGLADVLLKAAALAAEFQKLRIERILVECDPEVEQVANQLYEQHIVLLQPLRSFSAAVVSRVLSTPAGKSLMPFLRSAHPKTRHSPHVSGLMNKFREFVHSFYIRQKEDGKGYNLNVQQALCIAQTDSEPEAREQAMQALDSVMANSSFVRHLVTELRVLLDTENRHAGGFGHREGMYDGGFLGNADAAKAAEVAISGGGCGLYKRVLRIRKHVFIRSKEGLRFGWGDRLALGTPAKAGEGPGYEDAFDLVFNSIRNAAPPLAQLLDGLVKEKRIQVEIEPVVSRATIECPYEPSPLGVQLNGFGLTSPLTGTLLFFNYNSEAGAPGLAHFLWRHLMEAKLQELNPLMASFAEPVHSSNSNSSSSSSSSSRSVLAASNTLLVEAIGLWGRHLAFLEDINAVFNPQQQLRLLLSYLDETLGRVIKGSLRAAFGKKLYRWAASGKDADELERMWLRIFKDHFGPEGDVFDTYAGVRSQWLLFDSIEETLGYDGSNTAETLGYIFPPPKPEHLLAFIAIHKIANDCYFIKDYTKAQRARKPNQDVVAEAFNAFVAEAERDGLLQALAARGADLESSRYWSSAFHDVFDKPILEAEMLAQELSYFLTHKVKGATGLS